MEHLATDNILTLIEVLIVVYKLVGIIVFFLLVYIAIEYVKTATEYLKYHL